MESGEDWGNAAVFQQERPCHATQGHAGKHPGRAEAEGARGRHSQEPLLWFLWEREGEAGYMGLGLSSLNNFGLLWAIGVASCQISGPG